MKFGIDQKVNVLDGTGLFGRVVDRAYAAQDGALVATYKVACPEIGSKWYNELELAPLEPAPSAPAPSSAVAGESRADIMRSNDLFMHIQDVLENWDHSVATEFRTYCFLTAKRSWARDEEIATLQAALAAAREALAAANDLLDSIESASPQEQSDTLNAKMDFAYRRYFWVAGSKIRALKAQRAGDVDGAVSGDSGYSELVDELSGRIKGLERALKDTNDTLRYVIATVEMWGNDKMHSDEMLDMVRKVLQRTAKAQQPDA